MKAPASLVGALLLLVLAAGSSAAAVAPPALIAYSSADGSLYVANLQGANPKTLYETDDTASLQALDVSPDGKQVLAVSYSDDSRLVLVPVAGGSPVGVPGTASANSGSFSPDGKQIVFAVDDSSTEVPAAGIYTVPLSGGAPKSVTATPDNSTDALPAYSKDGSKLAFIRDTYDDNGDETVSLELMPASGGALKTLATGVAPDLSSGGRLSFSPDGTTIAFAGDSDQPGIFTVPVAGGDAKQLTQDYDYWPSFSADGSTIYFARDSTSTGAAGDGSPAVEDLYELWTVKKDGSGAAIVAPGDFESLALATGATSAGSSTGGTTTTTTTTPPKKKPAVTIVRTRPGVATAIAVKVSGTHYVVTWKGIAKSWTVVLKVGTKTHTAKVKGAVHSHGFVLRGAHGKASARVKSP